MTVYSILLERRKLIPLIRTKFLIKKYFEIYKIRAISCNIWPFTQRLSERIFMWSNVFIILLRYIELLE